MKGGVYSIVNKIDNKMYIGCTNNFKVRKYSHFLALKNNKHSNTHLQAAYNKYGKENFIFEVIEYCDEEFMYSQENYWCNMLDAHNSSRGYNKLKTGLHTTYKMHEVNKKNFVSKEKIILKCNIEGKPLKEYTNSEDLKKEGFSAYQVSGCVKKKENFNTHKNFTWIYKDEYDKNFKGLETIKRGKKRKVVSEEARKNMSEAQKKIYDPNKTHKLNNEDNKKAQEARRRKNLEKENPIIQFDINGNFLKEYKNISYVRLEGYACNGVGNSLNGRVITYKGYIWRYKKELSNYKTGNRLDFLSDKYIKNIKRNDVWRKKVVAKNKINVNS